jgi:C-terminal processing protease CtpA/Prc
MKRVFSFALSVCFLGLSTLSAQEPPVKSSNLIEGEGGTNARLERFLLAEQYQEMAIADLQSQLLSQLLVDVADNIYGAEFVVVSDSLKTQLNLPSGQGLVVASLRADGPTAAAGVQLHDILLTLGEKPLTKFDDLTTLLKASGEKPITLKLLRAGKPVSLQIRPIYQVTFGKATESKKEYFIGVSLEPVDATLRLHLNLPANRGVTISDVTKDSPAAKAGIQAHDILLDFGGKPVEKPESLAAMIQEGKDKATGMKLLRAGKTIELNVTPATREVEVAVGPEVGKYLRITANPRVAKLTRWVDAKDAVENAQVQKLEAEIRTLRDTLDKMNERLKELQQKK